MPWSPNEIAGRIAHEFSTDATVSLGSGLPLLIAANLDESVDVLLHNQHGVLGLGPKPAPRKPQHAVIDVEGQSLGVLPGGVFFDIIQSCAMGRGGHIDVCVLGALEVDQLGNLANWTVPDNFVHGVGAAMDLVVGAKKVIVAMNHLDMNGQPALVSQCTLPLTAAECVNTVVTDHGVFEIEDGYFRCTELAPGTTWAEIEAATEGQLILVEVDRKDKSNPDDDHRANLNSEDDAGELVAEHDWTQK